MAILEMKYSNDTYATQVNMESLIDYLLLAVKGSTQYTIFLNTIISYVDKFDYYLLSVKGFTQYL